MSTVNGVPSGGMSRPDNHFLGKLKDATKEYNSGLIIILEPYGRPEIMLSPYFDNDGTTIFYKIESLRTNTCSKYQQALILYRSECSVSATLCRFGVSRVPCRFGVGGDDPTSGLTGPKCQLHQMDSALVTIKDATELADKMKPHLGLIVIANPRLKQHYIHMFQELSTWKMHDSETLGSQLLREMSLVSSIYVQVAFSILITQLGPTPENLFHLYDGCAEFGCKQCLLCGGNFENTLHGPCALGNSDDKSNPRLFYGSLFKRSFYSGLVEFLQKIRTRD